ncbi:MAG: hypothetical protein XD82_1378 [Methanoculleus marisnigri]|uniref:Uncharacterized protein n=1 Tax=Methanoculleus marisnigri TaxID=2198 RepID=A0A101GME1_9EURY|nr:MAG: hypothetical protein XD82_1378 [Methanoculleus marisnigri]
MSYEDERCVDDLYDDEEEGAEREDLPGDTEPFDDPVAQCKRHDDLEQGDDGERGDNERVHKEEYFD